MAERVFRVAMVGARDIVTRRAKDAPPFRNELILSHLAALETVPNAELVAICRKNAALHTEFQQRWGDRWPGAKLYTDHREMLAKERPDIVGIATPDTVREEIVLDAVRAGVKGIFLEKPMATSVEEAERIVKACADAGVPLSVNHARRWYPIYSKVRDTVRSGAIGQLSTIVATLGGARAMLFRNGPHLLDLVSYFAESDPVLASARLQPGFEHWDRYMGTGGLDAASEPGADGLIIYRNGVRAHYCGSKDTLGRFSLHLAGPLGRITVDDNFAQLETSDPATKETITRNLLPPAYQVQRFAAGWQELVDVVEHGGALVSPGSEAIKTIRIIFAFLRSNRDGSRLVEV